MNFYRRIEKRFLENLNHRQSNQVFTIPEVLQENCRLSKMTLSPDSQYSGKTIRETDFRDSFNVSVVSVERGKNNYDLPKPDFQLFPYDKITFVGNEDKLRLLMGRIESFEDTLINEHENGDVDMYKVEVRPDSPYCGVMLKDSDLASRYNTMVIALERDGDFILNPSPRVAFAANDIVWFVASSANAKVLLAL